MKKFLKVALLVTVALVFMMSCASSVKPVERDPNAVYELVVLHTNDHHGSIDTKDNVGGLARRATFVQSIRDANENVLLLDAGDINTGSAVSNTFKARPDIYAYNLMGYNASAMGNHEFDNDLATFQEQMETASFPFLAANIKKADGSYLGKPYIIVDYEGFRVGVFGLTTNRTLVNSTPDKSLKFENEITVAAAMVDTLRNKEKADIVIALTHLGLVEEAAGQTTSEKLAQTVAGIDLIVDGHSHTKMTTPKTVNGIPIVSAYEWGKQVGKGMFTIKDGKVQSFEWTPVDVKADDPQFAPDKAVSDVLAPFIAEAGKLLKQVITTSTAEFEFGDRLSRKKEIALGDLVCDGTMTFLNQKGFAADFAIHNGGTIRTSLPSGDITREHITTVLPFDNYIYVLSLKGSDVIALFDFIASIPQGAGGFAQVSKEARYTIDYSAGKDKGKMKDLTINGVPVDPAKTYKIATNDYLASGGDGYTPFTKAVDTFNTAMTLRDVIIDYVQKLPQPITPKTDGRITIIGGMAL